eukprot:361794-Prymnesium_polylepis.1
MPTAEVPRRRHHPSRWCSEVRACGAGAATASCDRFGIGCQALLLDVPRKIAQTRLSHVHELALALSER